MSATALHKHQQLRSCISYPRIETWEIKWNKCFTDSLPWIRVHVFSAQHGGICFNAHEARCHASVRENSREQLKVFKRRLRRKSHCQHSQGQHFKTVCLALTRPGPRISFQRSFCMWRHQKAQRDNYYWQKCATTDNHCRSTPKTPKQKQQSESQKTNRTTIRHILGMPTLGDQVSEHCFVYHKLI